MSQRGQWLAALGVCVALGWGLVGCSSSSNSISIVDGGPRSTASSGGTSATGVTGGASGSASTTATTASTTASTSATGSSAGTSASTASTGAGDAGLGCTSNAECQGRPDGNKVCSVGIGACVGCLAASDCPMGQDCVANACTAYTSCTNSLGCSPPQVCDQSRSRCVQCVADADCATDEKCAVNVCQKRCTSDNTCTPLALLCDTVAGYCTKCVSHDDCAADHFCRQGECVLDTCRGGSTRCDVGGLSTCSAVGSDWIGPVACSSTQTCAVVGGVAGCHERVCSAASIGCSTVGEQVVVCSTDGLTATPATDCATMSQVCVAGACAPVVCTASTRFCQGTEVRTCSSKGNTSTLYTSCSTTQYCDAATAACKTQVCSANQPACNGTLATTCNANGSAYVAGGTDCTTSGQVCYQGACRALACAPNAYYCNLGSVYHCSADGTTSSLYSSCSTAQYCDGSTATATCKTRLCTANQPACNNQVATTCNADGSGYVAGGTDCTTLAEVCSQGTCANLACTPNAYYCNLGSVYHCSADGSTSALYSTCSTAQYCDSSTATATCKTRLCTAGQPACDLNVATTCNADGSGYTGVRTDCTPLAQSCAAGVCAAGGTSVDTADASPTTGTSTSSAAATKVEYYSVSSSRHLQKIEMYLSVTVSTTLTWVVYESLTQTGTYSLISSTMTTAPISSGYQASGALSVPLVAGRYYAIGVGWAGTVSYWFKSSAATQTTSFGSLIGGYTFTGTAPATVTYSNTNLYPIRLTTGP